MFIIEVFAGIEAADTALRSRGTSGSWADHRTSSRMTMKPHGRSWRRDGSTSLVMPSVLAGR